MLLSTSDKPKPDLTEFAHPEIDFVIFWVNGQDPEHKQKRQHYLQQFQLKDCSNAEQSTSDLRFVQHDELKYCLRSIKRYAPWYNRILLVTDDQFPAFLDPGLIAQERIEVVSHQMLFADREELLPTFSSRAIVSRLHTLKGLSELYLVGNDDVMLAAPVSPAFFFNQREPVIYADWISVDERPAGLNLQANLRAAELMGFSAQKFLMPSHGFLPFDKTTVSLLEKRFPQVFEDNIKHKFRHESQLLLESLYNHFKVECAGVTVQPTEMMVHFSCELCRKGPTDKLAFLFNLLREGQRKMFCINEYAALHETFPDVVDILDEICGPPLNCEVQHHAFPE